MKFEYFEGKFGMEITMEPETPKECAELLRISANANSEKPQIYFSFESNNPRCAIYIQKRKESAQKNSIKP